MIVIIIKHCRWFLVLYWRILCLLKFPEYAQWGKLCWLMHICVHFESIVPGGCLIFNSVQLGDQVCCGTVQAEHCQISDSIKQVIIKGSPLIALNKLALFRRERRFWIRISNRTWCIFLSACLLQKMVIVGISTFLGAMHVLKKVSFNGMGVLENVDSTSHIHSLSVCEGGYGFVFDHCRASLTIDSLCLLLAKGNLTWFVSTWKMKTGFALFGVEVLAEHSCSGQAAKETNLVFEGSKGKKEIVKFAAYISDTNTSTFTFTFTIFLLLIHPFGHLTCVESTVHVHKLVHLKGDQSACHCQFASLLAHYAPKILLRVVYESVG